ncbi:glycosyltransferase [bacterium]|nr:glycosyltransferase [candidate division CSSED10-310 bacterium]
MGRIVEPGGLPAITVAVCVYNGAVTIESCLESLMNLEYPRDRITILVVDDGSTDRTPEIIRRFPVRCITGENRGVAHARNTALAHAETDLIAFIDADCRADSRWLVDLVPLFDQAQTGVVGGKIVTPGEHPLARYYQIRRIVSNEEFSGDYPFSPPFLATANVMFRRDLVVGMGGFNPAFRAGEDADLCWRIQQTGYRIVYIPAGTVYHHHRTTLRELFRQAVLYGCGGVQLYAHHRNRMGWKRWIWWGLYARWLMAACSVPPGIFRKTPLGRRMAIYDTVRLTGVVWGRLKGAFQFRVGIL